MEMDHRKGGNRPVCTIIKTGVNLWWQAEMEAKQSPSQVLSKNATWILTSDRAGQKARDKMWKRAVRWKWYGHAGWSCSLDSSLFLCLFTSPPLSLLGRLTLPFICLTAHRRRDEWQHGEGWKSRMKDEGRMSSRRTSKCSPADLLEELEKKNVCAWKTWLETALMQQYWTFRCGKLTGNIVHMWSRTFWLITLFLSMFQEFSSVVSSSVEWIIF